MLLKEDLEDFKIKEYQWNTLKRLNKYILPYKNRLIIVMILLMFSSIGELLLPYLTKIAIDKYIIIGYFSGLWKISLIYFGLLLFNFITSYYHEYIIQLTGQKIMYDLRLDLFSHLQYLPVSFFNKTPVGKIMTRLTNDIEVLNELFTGGVIAIIGDIFVLTGILIAIFLLNSSLAFIIILILPLIFIISFYFQKNFKETYNRVRFWLSKMNAFLQECIMGMSIIQIFNYEKRSFNSFDNLNREYKKANLDAIFYYALFYPTIELIGAISIAIILFFGGAKILLGTMTFGTLVAFIQYSDRFFHPISDLAEKYNTILSSIIASERIFRLLDEPKDVQYNGIELLIKEPPLISFQNVSFSYNEEPVLKNITFEIKPKEKVALIGPTGAGKSTIINLLLKFYDNYTGNIFLNGIDIRKVSAHSLRKHIGIVFQEPFLFSKTLKDNLYLGSDSIDENYIEKLTYEVLGEKFKNRFYSRLEYKIGERGIELSTGERQLIAFIRALSINPLILILDEATSAIDPETEYWIQYKINDWLYEHTALIIAHRLSTIKKSDRIILLSKGKIIEEGTHKELLERNTKYALFCKYYVR